MNAVRQVPRLALGALAATAALGSGGGLAWAAGNAPPGNNGTVKIDGYTVDSGPDNDAHVGCGFSVTFYGYDGGPQSASLTITPVAPTAGGAPYHTSTSWNVGTRTSGNQYDTSVQVSGAAMESSLSGVTPQGQQGYHLRLEVEVTGSQGSDDKFKTFWMTPCAGAAGPAVTAAPATAAPVTAAPTTAAVPVPKAAPAVTAPAASSVQAIPAPTTTTTLRAVAFAAGSSAAASSAGVPSGVGAADIHAAALGNETVRSALGAATDTVLATSPLAVPSTHGASTLAFTGADIAGMVIGGLTLVGLGGGAVLATRRRRATRSIP